MLSVERMLVVAATLAAVGLILLWLARRGRGRSGLPEGRIVYTDTGGWQRPERPLFSHRLRLSGKPDYLVKSGAAIIPVEVKSGPAPGRPYASHLLQLAAYCLLVEEAYETRPSHGMIKYGDRTVRVGYGVELEEELVQTLRQMRADLAAGHASRRHNDPRRCAACGHRAHCDQRLV